MAIKNIAGQPVRGDNFFDRPALVREFQKKINSGGSILISALGKGMLYPKHALYFTEALAAASIPEELQHEVITWAREFLGKTDKTLLKELSKSDIELFKEAVQFYKNGEFLKALRKFEDIQNKNGRVLYDIAFLCQTEIKDYQKAEEYYSMAVEKSNTEAMNSLAYLYFAQKKNKTKALTLISKSVKKAAARATRQPVFVLNFEPLRFTILHLFIIRGL